MAVKIRLQRGGKKRHSIYSIVAADARAPRDGRYIEKLGQYNPNTTPATIDVDIERALDWLHKGAKPTHTVRAILSYKGVMYKKHLLRGVDKGALTPEQAEEKFTKWVEEQNAKISVVREKHRKSVKKQREAVITAGAEEAAKKAAARLQSAQSDEEAANQEETTVAENVTPPPKKEADKPVNEAQMKAEKEEAVEDADKKAKSTEEE